MTRVLSGIQPTGETHLGKEARGLGDDLLLALGGGKALHPQMRGGRTAFEGGGYGASPRDGMIGKSKKAWCVGPR